MKGFLFLILVVGGIWYFSTQENSSNASSLDYSSSNTSQSLSSPKKEELSPKALAIYGLKENNIEKIRTALDGGIYINSKFIGYGNMLGYYISYDDNTLILRTVKFLVENDVDINKVQKNGKTALHMLLASKAKNKDEILDYLLRKGANVNAYNSSVEKPIFYAKNKTDFIKLINKGASLYSTTNTGKIYKSGLSSNLLMHAAFKDYYYILKYLIEDKDFDPFGEDSKGNNVLVYAKNGLDQRTESSNNSHNYIKRIYDKKENEFTKVANNSFSQSEFQIQTDYDHSYYEYTTDTYIETSYYGGVAESRLKGGVKHSEVLGIKIKGKLYNPLKYIDIRARVRISFTTSDYETSPGENCNTLHRGGSFSDYVNIDIDANSSTFIEKYFSTKTRGTTKGFCFHLSGIDEHGTYINSSSLKIEVVSVTKR